MQLLRIQIDAVPVLFFLWFCVWVFLCVMGSTVWSVLFKLMDTETLDDCIEDSLFSSSVFCQMFLCDHACECKLSNQYFDCVSSSG